VHRAEVPSEASPGGRSAVVVRSKPGGSDGRVTQPRLSVPRAARSAAGTSSYAFVPRSRLPMPALQAPDRASDRTLPALCPRSNIKVSVRSSRRGAPRYRRRSAASGRSADASPRQSIRALRVPLASRTRSTASPNRPPAKRCNLRPLLEALRARRGQLRFRTGVRGPSTTTSAARRRGRAVPELPSPPRADRPKAGQHVARHRR
jgi:hypothetical protein